jgi:hypothetical protein
MSVWDASKKFRLAKQDGTELANIIATGWIGDYNGNEWWRR